MDIITKRVKDLTPVEFRACKNANFGKYEGSMWEALVEGRYAEDESLAIMLWNGPDNTIRSLRGWALMTPIDAHCILSVTANGRRRSKFVAQFWVKRPYRRKGLGKMLTDEVYKHDLRPYAYVHDHITGHLFHGRRFSTERDYRSNLPKGKPVAA